VQPVDLIFVMAGRMERKHYGLELYRAKVSARLVLSVGRFEVSKTHTLGLEISEKLKALRDRLPPDQRHFFVSVDASGVRIENVDLPRWSTYGEVLGLRQFLEREGAHRIRITIVSTGIHLRRVAFTCSRVFRGSPVEFLYCAVPERWTRPHGRWFAVKEMIKLVGYRVILPLPPWAARRLMRLKH
jgi:hypothetical protein